MTDRATGELDLIELIRSALADRSRGRVLRWTGDDAAVVRARPLAVTSIDTVVEDVHFSLATHSPADVGWKAMATALSDLAAMGADAGRGLRVARPARRLRRGRGAGARDGGARRGHRHHHRGRRRGRRPGARRDRGGHRLGRQRRRPGRARRRPRRRPGGCDRLAGRLGGRPGPPRARRAPARGARSAPPAPVAAAHGGPRPGPRGRHGDDRPQRRPGHRRPPRGAGERGRHQPPPGRHPVRTGRGGRGGGVRRRRLRAAVRHRGRSIASAPRPAPRSRWVGEVTGGGGRLVLLDREGRAVEGLSGYEHA